MKPFRLRLVARKAGLLCPAPRAGPILRKVSGTVGTHPVSGPGGLRPSGRLRLGDKRTRRHVPEHQMRTVVVLVGPPGVEARASVGPRKGVAEERHRSERRWRRGIQTFVEEPAVGGRDVGIVAGFSGARARGGAQSVLELCRRRVGAGSMSTRLCGFCQDHGILVKKAILPVVGPRRNQPSPNLSDIAGGTDIEPLKPFFRSGSQRDLPTQNAGWWT